MKRLFGISLPGTGEEPHCPVYIDGQHFTTLKGTYEELAHAFRALVDDYIATKYPAANPPPQSPPDDAWAGAAKGERGIQAEALLSERRVEPGQEMVTGIPTLRAISRKRG